MSQKSISWGELALLTHKTQVKQFNFCTCEEQEYFPFADCPRPAPVCGDCLYPLNTCNCEEK